MKYNSVLDLHTHTIVSGHAYSTLREMAKAASDKGLELLGITEHAPKMPGTCHLFYFDNLRIVPRELYGIELVLGSEVNILDAKGTVDLPQKTMEKLVQGNAGHSRNLAKFCDQIFRSRDAAAVDDETDHNLFRLESITDQYVTHQTLPGHLIIGRNIIRFHMRQYQIQNLFVDLHA